jgi:hypothetical protein
MLLTKLGKKKKNTGASTEVGAMPGQKGKKKMWK